MIKAGADILIKSKKWVVMDCNKEKAIEISQKYNISPLIASVILNRGITDDEVENYISKDSSQFCDPFLLTDMKKAVDFINEAISKNTKIAVYGDYNILYSRPC